MIPAANDRCPVCGALTLPDQTTCRRCFEPLQPSAVTPVAPATGETCKMYRSKTGSAMLLVSRVLLEYTAADVNFHTDWSNVAAVVHYVDDDLLKLYQTPKIVRMPLRAGRTWFSDRTMTIPLRQFGYPRNEQLKADLLCFAPHLKRHFAGDSV